jgi:hypothetical protein
MQLNRSYAHILFQFSSSSQAYFPDAEFIELFMRAETCMALCIAMVYGLIPAVMLFCVVSATFQPNGTKIKSLNLLDD